MHIDHLKAIAAILKAGEEITTANLIAQGVSKQDAIMLSSSYTIALAEAFIREHR